MNADTLIAEYNSLTDHVEAESKQFAERMKPHNTRVEEIKNLLLAMLNEQNADSIKTDHGTAYKSVIVTPKATDKVKFLDFCLENWDVIGNDMLQIGAPKKDAVKNWQDDHAGALPPFVETSAFTRINIRRS